MGFFGSLLGSIPVVGSVLGAAGNVLQGNAADKAAKDQARLNNQYLGQYDQANRDIVNRLTAAGYDPFGPQTSYSSQQGGTQGTSTTRGVQDVDMFTRPEVLAAYAPMEARYRQLIEGRLGQPSPVTEGEIASTLRGINRSSEGALRQVQNLAGGRGLSAQQLQAAATPLATARAGQIADFLASIPQVERQRQAEDLALAQGAIGQFGTGQRQTGRTTTASTTNQSGTSYGGGSQTSGPDVNTLMALMRPAGPQASMQTGNSTFGNILSGLGGAASVYAAGQKPKPQPQTLPTQPFNNFLY